jgi:hypothetical protein
MVCSYFHFKGVSDSRTGAVNRQKVGMQPNTSYRAHFIKLGAISRYYTRMDEGYDIQVVEIDRVTLKLGQRKTRGIELAAGRGASLL